MQRKKVLSIFLFLFSILFIFYIFSTRIFLQTEDFLFFSLKNPPIDNNYIFHVKYNKEELKNINLMDTMQFSKTSTKKIAPGSSGSFQLILISNKNTEVEIEWIHQKRKPENLIFYEVENDVSKEILGKKRIYLDKEKKKTIKIQWIWKYEVSSKGDQQDVIAAREIQNYSFLIKIIGEAVEQ